MGKKIGIDGINEYYGTASVRQRDEVNLTNAIEYAVRMGKKKILILEKDGYNVKEYDR